MKISVFNDGSVMVIKSENKLDEIKKVSEFSPKSLQKMDADGNLLYSAHVASAGKGSINRNGVQFAPETGNDGLAKITVDLPTMEGGIDVKDYVADKYGAAIEYLHDIDQQIKGALDGIGQTRSRVRQMINIVG